MLTLGIETSGGEGAIAIVRDGLVLAESDAPQEGRRQTQLLIPTIVQLLKQNAIPFSDLDLIGVSLGPGSFTGLRVGVVCAQTLAYSLACPVRGVLTCDVIAKNVPTDGEVQELSVLADAQRGDVFVATFQRQKGKQGDVWVRNQDVVIQNLEEWRTEINRKMVVTGPALKRFQNSLLENSHLQIMDKPYWRATPANVAILAEKQFEVGEEPSEKPFFIETILPSAKCSRRKMEPCPS